MKTIKRLLLVLFVFAAAAAFVACGDTTESKAENTVTFSEISPIDCYGTPALNATALGDAAITYTYATQENGTYGAAPEHFVAGTYWVKATSAETDEYLSASATRSFTVSHKFDRETAEEDFLKTAATCTDAAVYNKSCVCGEAGTETFTYGTAKGHTPSAEYWSEKGTYYYKETCAECDALLSSSEKIELVKDAEGEHTVTVCSWAQDDLKRGNDLIAAFGNNWSQGFYASLMGGTDDLTELPEGLTFEPAVKYSVMSGTYVMVALPLFDYSAYEEVSFYMYSNGRPFTYGTLFNNFGTYGQDGTFTLEGTSLITVKSDRKVYVDGVALTYTLDKQVYCGTLPLTFVGKGEDPALDVYVSNLTAKFAEKTDENAPVYAAGRIFAADEGNTSVMTDTELIAHIDAPNKYIFPPNKAIFYYDGRKNGGDYSDGGYYAHMNQGCETYTLRVKTVNFAAYNAAGLNVSFKVRTMNNTSGFSLLLGDTAILENGAQSTDHTIEIKEGKLFVDGAEKTTLSDAVYYGEEGLTLTVKVNNYSADTDKYAGISISAVEASAAAAE